MEKFPKFNPSKILSIILLLGIAFSVITIVNANGVAPNAGHDSTAVSGGVATGNLFYGSTTNVLVSLAAVLVTTAAGLLGVIVGGWITARRQREERRHNQIKEQLEHFYSPMLGMRELVRSKTEVRVNITATAKKLPSVESEDLTKIIEYNKEQLRKELMPLYRKMIDHFTDHLWLAEPRTRAYYRTLIEFVEIWERRLQGTMPGEVAQEIGHSEEKLQPFYDNLEETLEQLRQELNQ